MIKDEIYLSINNANIALKVRVAELEADKAKLVTAIIDLSKHRNIICAGETRCGKSDCSLLSHNYIVLKTEEARDAYANVLALIKEQG